MTDSKRVNSLYPEELSHQHFKIKYAPCKLNPNQRNIEDRASVSLPSQTVPLPYLPLHLFQNPNFGAMVRQGLLAQYQTFEDFQVYFPKRAKQQCLNVILSPQEWNGLQGIPQMKNLKSGYPIARRVGQPYCQISKGKARVQEEDKQKRIGVRIWAL